MAVIPPSPKGVRGLIPSAFIGLLPLVKLVLSLSKEGAGGILPLCKGLIIKRDHIEKPPPETNLYAPVFCSCSIYRAVLKGAS
jgi:hypothetical protein